MTSRSSCLTFRQLDNKTGTGYRECFSSAAAMVAAYYKKVRTDDEYNEIRAKFGDTTSVDAQLAALRSLGLEAEFRKDGDADMVELEIENGRPVLVSRLSRITETCFVENHQCAAVLNCGHWLIISSGYAGQEQQRPGMDRSRPSWLSRDGEGWP